MEKSKLIAKIENGKQMGVRKIIQIDGVTYSYDYAIQKIDGKYIVYMVEFNLDTYYMDEFGDAETFLMYDSLEDFLADFDHQHGVEFEDFTVSKGQKFFNPDIVKYRPDLIQHK